jgi:hypothetical protein
MTTRGSLAARQIADPVERARALRAERQSKPPAGAIPAGSASKSPVARPGSGVAAVARPGSAPRPGLPVDRTLGARKRADHLAPKKAGIDHRLAEFQASTRTIRRKAPEEGAARVSPSASPAPPAEAHHSGEEDGDREEREDRAVAERVLGNDENWFETLQRKQEDERERVEQEEKARRKEAERIEREQREEEQKRIRKEEEEVRRKELEQQRAVRQAEKREKSEREREERLRQLEEDRVAFLKQAGVGATPELAGAPAQSVERTARKARIAELVSKVRSVSINNGGEDDAL